MKKRCNQNTRTFPCSPPACKFCIAKDISRFENYLKDNMLIMLECAQLCPSFSTLAKLCSETCTSLICEEINWTSKSMIPMVKINSYAPCKINLMLDFNSWLQTMLHALSPRMLCNCEAHTPGSAIIPIKPPLKQLTYLIPPSLCLRETLLWFW